MAPKSNQQPVAYMSEEQMKLWEEQIIFYKDHLDIAIEDLCAPIKLTDVQHVIARNFGRASDIKIVCSRGFGKTWLTAVVCHTICVLCPGTLVAVASGTAAQATLVLQKIKLLADQNENIRNELSLRNSRSYVRLAKDKGIAEYKNGSKIESYSIDSLRGTRAKIVVIDETPEVQQEAKDAIVAPIKNYTRDICFAYGAEDFMSKTVEITSACPKSNSFYEEFVRVVREMGKGNPEAWACALDYHAPARTKISSMDFFMSEKAKLPDLVFQMEYGSRFVGSTDNTAFPYELVESCRTLKTVETCQPKGSKSRYVLALDIATSEAKNADNSIISIIKFSEHTDGTFSKKLVYMRSFHGKGLDVLANEVRILVHKKFPNIEKIVYDARGLGDSFDRFMDREWIDVDSGKEYPALVCDDIPMPAGGSIPLLHAFRAIQTLNQRLYTNYRVSLEQRTIELPIQSKDANNTSVEYDEDGNEDVDDIKAQKLTQEEKAIFVEADALQMEMGNIVGKVGASGNVLYDVEKQGQHKDRYSSSAMAIDYVMEIEKETVKKHKRGDLCIGFADDIDEHWYDDM